MIPNKKQFVLFILMRSKAKEEIYGISLSDKERVEVEKKLEKELGAELKDAS